MNRRKFLEISARTVGLICTGAGGAFITASTQAEDDGGSNRLLLGEYSDVIWDNVEFLMQHYGIEDPNKAKALYNKVIVETALLGAAAGVLGPVFCMSGNSIKFPFIKKGGLLMGAFNIVTSELVGQGTTKKAQDAFLEEHATFLSNPESLVRDYGMKPDKALQFCDDYRKAFYSQAGIAAQFSSIVYQGSHWVKQGVQCVIRAFSNRRENVMRESDGMLKPETGAPDTITVEFEIVDPKELDM